VTRAIRLLKISSSASPRATRTCSSPCSPRFTKTVDWEWCWDPYGSYEKKSATDPLGADIIAGRRVLRGGSFNFYARNVRAARRFDYSPGKRDYNMGFRCSSTRLSPTLTGPGQSPALHGARERASTGSSRPSRPIAKGGGPNICLASPGWEGDRRSGGAALCFTNGKGVLAYVSS